MFLLPEMRYITVSLAGIRCPGYRKGEDGNDVPEPFADEAKFFTEARLLNRDVRVALQAVTNNMFLGTIVHPRGNISELLLKVRIVCMVILGVVFACLPCTRPPAVPESIR